MTYIRQSLIFVFLLPLVACAESYIILKTPVSIEASVISSEPATAQYMAEYVFALTLRKGSSVESIKTDLIAVKNLQDALNILHEEVLWRPPYLFIRSECGGANAWACNKDVVFEVAPDNLVRIGAFGVPEDPRRAGLSLHEGHFFDIYDKLEAKILCHACGPSFTIVLLYENGHLQVSPDLTWLNNRIQYQKHQATIDSWLSGRTGDTSDAFEAIVASAVLAKYCNRQQELAALVHKIDSYLDKDHRESLQAALQLCVPLELPGLWRLECAGRNCT